MRTMSAGDFKTHCLRITEEVRRRREGVFITKSGVPVAKLMPAVAVLSTQFPPGLPHDPAVRLISATAEGVVPA